VRLHDQRGHARSVGMRFAARPASVHVVSPLELDGEALALGGDGHVAVPLGARELVSIRVRFDGGVPA
jgi:hypothetical protein